MRVKKRLTSREKYSPLEKRNEFKQHQQYNLHTKYSVSQNQHTSDNRQEYSTHADKKTSTNSTPCVTYSICKNSDTQIFGQNYNKPADALSKSKSVKYDDNINYSTSEPSKPSFEAMAVQDEDDVDTQDDRDI